MLRHDVDRDAVAVAGCGMDEALIQTALAHDLLRADAVLVRIAFKVQIMQQTDNAPKVHLVPIAELLRKIAHDTLDRSGMMQMEWILIEFRQQRPSLRAIQLLAHCESLLNTYRFYR